MLKDYPYQVDDGREDPDVEGIWVLRGGSFDGYFLYSRCASRCWHDLLDDRLRDDGFRLVVAAPFSRRSGL